MIAARSLVVLVAAAAFGNALAEPKPEVVIEYRQSVMTMIGWNFGPLAGMAKDRIPFDAKEFALRAERLQSLAPQALEGFSKGSNSGAKTDAKAEIWSDFGDFQGKMSDFVNETKALAALATSTDQAKIKDQIKKTGASCKACHEKYKEQ